MYTCALCKIRACRKGDMDKAPKNCPNLETNKGEILALYNEPENYKLAVNSALLEGNITRIEEIISFANKCGYKNLGIAFCIGLSKEAEILHKILSHHKFKVNSIICKNGSLLKNDLNMEDNKAQSNSFRPICNPIGQALFLNKAKTDFNIILGLCVGHDSLFIKYSEAPVTVLAVKDRVLAHNPLGALYCAESYYRKKLFPKD